MNERPRCFGKYDDEDELRVVVYCEPCIHARICKRNTPPAEAKDERIRPEKGHQTKMWEGMLLVP